MKEFIFTQKDEVVKENERNRARNLCIEFNQTKYKSIKKQKTILKNLLGNFPDTAQIMQPFFCDYGYNITLGEHSFINHSCTY